MAKVFELSNRESEVAERQRIGGQGAKRFYRPELDAIRFIAFFTVFLAHYPRPKVEAGDFAWVRLIKQWMGAFQGSSVLGMGIFFILSAFLITELLLREQNQTGKIHLKAFYVRRILRIWPLYFLALFLGYLVSKSGTNESIGVIKMLAFLLLAGNWYTARDGYAPNPITPLWSISLEEQFYIIWPSVVRLGSRKKIIVTCGAIICIGLGALMYGRHRGMAMEPALWTNSFVQFPLFAVGALVAVCLRGNYPKFPLWSRPIIFLSGIGLWQVAESGLHIIYGKASSIVMPAGFCIAIVGSLLIFLSLLGIPSRYVPEPFRYLGKISYGLYVYAPFAGFLLGALFPHLSISWSSTLLIILGITIGLASLSYYLFEKPFLSLKQRFEFVLSRKA